MKRMYDGGPLPEIGRTAVTDRWFQAFDDLVQAGRTSKSRICLEMGVERRNFTKQQKDHSRAILRRLHRPTPRRQRRLAPDRTRLALRGVTQRRGASLRPGVTQFLIMTY